MSPSSSMMMSPRLTPTRQGGVAPHHALLDDDGAAHCFDGTVERDEGAVAGILDQAAVVLRDRRVDQLAADTLEPRESAFLVDAHQPAVAADIGGKHGREAPFALPVGRGWWTRCKGMDFAGHP
jgi:hypothetical protein